MTGIDLRGGSRLRVGYVLKMFPRLSETFILSEVLGLEDAGVDVSVLSLRHADEGRFHADLALVRGSVDYVPQFGSASTVDALDAVAGLGPGCLGGLRRALAFVGGLPAAGRAGVLVQALHLARQVDERALDHLHAHFMTIAAHTAYIAHLLTGVPFSVTAHAKDIYRAGVNPANFREVAAAATAVVTVCDANERYILDHLLTGSPARVERIYNGIDTESLPSPAPRRDPTLVLGVGRLVEKKGFDVLLDACAILVARGVPVSCLVLGDGEERAALEAQRTALGLEDRVRFGGAVPKHEVLGWMTRARVLALPCVTGADGNRDALPTVLIEALALGLPAVSSAVAGVPEIVDDGVNGLLVAEGDPNALADAIGALVAEDDRWSQLSAAGPAKVAARFDRRQTMPQLLSVFHRSGYRENVA
jgi:glycosyltransferase involved in cell wall biosynthesis